MDVAIHWFRRDLRLSDNTALSRAAQSGVQILPLYIASQWRGSHHWCGYPRQAFLSGCLQSLDRAVRAHGGRLVIRSGLAVEILEKVAIESRATAIYYNRDPDPHGRAMEQAVKGMAARRGIQLMECKDHALHERDEVLTASGSPYRVFTPYARAWSKLEKPRASGRIGRIKFVQNIASEDMPTSEHWRLRGSTDVLEAGESAARRRLETFLAGPIFHYRERRDFAAEDGTSRLSQDLRHGTLSIREIHARCEDARAAAKTPAQKQNVSAFINELIWREFYFQVLWHWPEVLEHEFAAGYRQLPWRARWRPEEDQAWEDDPAARLDLDRWRAGETGFPIVDAGMRQLIATGFMHNRLRMITAMFLAKDLRIWWMHGEAHFMQHLVDGEIASNNGGWQWCASTGTDAAPYFRIQNPWTQAKRFDPQGSYIKHWIPELRDVPPAQFFRPPTAGTTLARGYPPPMLDHASAREETLNIFQSARRSIART